jgi:MFS family permease
VVPALRAEFALTASQGALLTSSVQVGFVTGTLVSAALTLPDRIDPRRLFFASALAGAAANAMIAHLNPASTAVVALRFVTGMTMAGVYPVGMKLAASWARRDTGLLIGILVGALTLGSASPHLFAGLISDWRGAIRLASLVAAAGGLLVLAIGVGPTIAKAPPLDPRLALRLWTQRGLRLANLGYLGHMWELYAMWAWLGVFLTASFSQLLPAEEAGRSAKLVTFASVSAGAIGSLAGGWIADRVGRTALTSGAMAISGSCAVVVGLLFGGDPWLLAALCVVWGVTIVADSAQLSASIVELSTPGLVGTMLTMQTCSGFLLTLVTIQALPYVVDAVGWRYAFAFLAIGPAFGVASMLALRRLPESRKLAGGRR